jgi:tetratricopeptide (TPR) repeat protein
MASSPTFDARIAQIDARHGPGAGHLVGALAWIDALERIGALAAAERAARASLQRLPGEAALFLRYAQLQQAADRRGDAAIILDHGAQRFPGDLRFGRLIAQVALERGQVASGLFAKARRHEPDALELALGEAVALDREGQADAALERLEVALNRAPVWLQGLGAMARMLWTRHGTTGDATQPYRKAITQAGSRLELWMGMAGWLASAGQFEEALKIADEAIAVRGEHPLLQMVRAQALDEIGESKAADAALAKLAGVDDPGFAPVRLRALLRRQHYDTAASLAQSLRGGPGEAAALPYLGLAWQLAGDSRAQWLLHPDLVMVQEIDLASADLAGLAGHVRNLHPAGWHPHDQSARGGTQTEGALFDRTDPPIEALRLAVRGAVERYLQTLPPIDPDHPLLCNPRDAFRFAGSWSIRLQGAGFHVPHCHPQGWISSALYLAVPQATPGEAEQAGHLGIGSAPPELGLPALPERTVAPQPGRLVLFPSYAWHGTKPFGAGERMSVAFDLGAYAW